ncbi:hypothetical protein IKG60_00520 [Candidatus Saccharibacteria bacterium]|nr:hypothetical protein [Candidatus Saccharibacteria bacterium]
MKSIKHKNKGSKIIIVAVVVAVIVLGVGAFFGVRAIYDSGVADGRWLESDEIAERVRALGAAVSEKANFQQSINAIFADVPKELNVETIDTYIAKLEELVGKTKVESIETILQEYLGRWRTFKETYSGENNSQIEESFNGLKSITEDTAKKIKTQYDEAVTEAIRGL